MALKLTVGPPPRFKCNVCRLHRCKWFEPLCGTCKRRKARLDTRVTGTAS